MSEVGKEKKGKLTLYNIRWMDDFVRLIETHS